MADEHAHYALGRLADAADALETGAGTVHERLFEAFTHLVLISPEDVPDGELRPAFRELMAALTSEEPKGTEGRLVATLKMIDDEHAQDIARAIIDRLAACCSECRGGLWLGGASRRTVAGGYRVHRPRRRYAAGDGGQINKFWERRGAAAAPLLSGGRGFALAGVGRYTGF